MSENHTELERAQKRILALERIVERMRNTVIEENSNLGQIVEVLFYEPLRKAEGTIAGLHNQIAELQQELEAAKKPNIVVMQTPPDREGTFAQAVAEQLGKLTPEQAEEITGEKTECEKTGSGTVERIQEELRNAAKRIQAMNE